MTKLRYKIEPICLLVSSKEWNRKGVFVKMILRASEKKCKVWTQAPTEYEPWGNHLNPRGLSPGVHYLFMLYFINPLPLWHTLGLFMMIWCLSCHDMMILKIRSIMRSPNVGARKDAVLSVKQVINDQWSYHKCFYKSCAKKSYHILKTYHILKNISYIKN